MSDTPSVCPFCGSYVALLDDGTPCGDLEGNWTAFRCLTSWHRGYPDPRKLQSKTCETAERHKLHDRIQRLVEAGDKMAELIDGGVFMKYAVQWYEAKEVKP